MHLTATDLMERMAKLPPIAYLDNRDGSRAHIKAQVIVIERGCSGFTPLYTLISADELNAQEDVTKAQAEAMYAGSIFGWHVPAADPDNYDENGVLKAEVAAQAVAHG